MDGMLGESNACGSQPSSHNLSSQGVGVDNKPFSIWCIGNKFC